MLKKIIAAAAFATLASSAFAAQPGTFYAGLDAGSTKVDDLGESKASYGGFVGYNFHPNFAAEVGARRLGSWGDVDVNQYQVSLVGTLPLQNNFNVFGRVGYNKLDADGNGRGNASDNGG